MSGTFGLTNDEWTAINAIAAAASAIGTFAAVVVALRLARREMRVRLSVRSGIARSIPPGGKWADGIDYFFVRATNVGFPNVTVTHIT